MKHTIELDYSIGETVFHINSRREAYENKITSISITKIGITYKGNITDFDDSRIVFKTKNEATIELIKRISEDLE